MSSTLGASGKTTAGNFFEDFRLGQVFEHATPRTVTSGDVALYQALYGSRFALQSSDEFARGLGLPRAPVDDLLVFHIVFGKTVPDISLNAVANLGYADCRFMESVYPGDTLATTSEVIGLKENSNHETGVVYVRSTGTNQHGRPVLIYCRWVMVRKRDMLAAVAAAHVPALPERVDPAKLAATFPAWSTTAAAWARSGTGARFADYKAGERIDHVDGMTIEEAEHQMATRLYQNTAKVHFNQHTEGQGRFKRRLVYGGVVISLARALSFNGLANAGRIVAINGGRHVAPAFAGDTVYAWSEVVETAPLPSRRDAGLLRLRTFATKNRPCADFPGRAEKGHADGVILELDYWVAVPT